jgi:hypothetical protein
MKKLSPSEIEAEITQAHANILALDTDEGRKRVPFTPHSSCDRALVRELRAVYTLGHDQGTAEAAERGDFGKLNFPGGPVTIPRATSHELLLNVRQWLTAAREAAHEERSPGSASEATRRAFTYITSCLDNAMHALREVDRDTLPPGEEPTQPNNEAPVQS